MNVNLYAPTTQYPGANATVSIGGPHSPAHSLMASDPEHRLLAYASRIVAKPKLKARQERECLDKMEITGMRHYKAVTQFVIQEHGFEEKVRSELAANDCPEAIASAITNNMMLVEKEMKVKTDCRVDGGQGNLFKIAWCMERDGGRARVSFMVFGASFTAEAVEHYKTEKTPVFEEVPVTKTKGWLWWRTVEEGLEYRKVREDEVKTPVFKTMSSSQVSQCMDMLELQACEKVIEASEHVPAEVARSCSAPSIAAVALAPRLLAWLPTLLGLVAVGLARYTRPKSTRGISWLSMRVQ